MGVGARPGPADGALTTAQIAWRLLPLYFTHINQALLTTLPFAVAVYMVRDFEAAKGGVANEQTIGRATGMLAAAFCAAQLLTSYPWGMVSDRIGRKPVLVVGNVSCVVSVLLFGLSGTYWQAMAARAVGGALNAIILCEKAMIGEGLPTKDSQAKAFGLMSLCWGLGSLAGPMVGGALSAPCRGALRLEALCGEGALLVHRPYFLPCLVAGLLSAAATLMTIAGLEETLPSRRRNTPAVPGGDGQLAAKARYAAVPAAEAADSPRQGREVELGGMSSGGKAAAGGGPRAPPFRGDSAHFSPGSGGGEGPPKGGGSPTGSWRSSEAEPGMVGLSAEDLERGQEAGQGGERQGLLPGALPAPGQVAAAAAPWYRQRAVVSSLLGYGLIAFFYNMLDEVTPIFASAGVPDGGLGFAPAELAPSLSFGGFVLVCWALKGFPWLMRRVGVVRACRMGLWQTAPLALLIPCASLFRGARLPGQALMFLTMGLKAISGTNAFTACLILVNANAPQGCLGAVNGAGQSLASLVRALGPALGGLSWGWSAALARRPAWPAWLPHQFLPFAAASLLALGTDAVYWGMHMPQ